MNASEELLSFAERLLVLIDQGRTTATYKYALLLALMDVCMQQTTSDGRAPTSVATADLASRIVELYWPQTGPYVGLDAVGVLRQNSKGQAGIVREIERFRMRHSPDPSMPLSEARRSTPESFHRLTRRVEWILIKMPIPRLQYVGSGYDPFIFKISWSPDVTARQASSPSFDRRLYFIGSAGESLVRLTALLRPLLETKWTELVTRFNAELVVDSALPVFLFGSQRISTTKLRDPLWELQAGKCFYCEHAIHSKPEVDHFIPWSRVPDNGIENLVLADASCNANKRAFVAATRHLEKWSLRFKPGSSESAAMEKATDNCEWERHPDKTLGVARATYLRMPAGSRLWLTAKTFEPPNHQAILTALSGS